MTIPGTIIVIGGPSGTGKTTAAIKLAKYLNCPYIEGDSLHLESNIKKMSKGEPLTDEDRWEWLIKLTQASTERCKDSANHITIVTCSMLKQSYRVLIKETGIPFKFKFCFLYASYSELLNRVKNRQNHYMKSDMVKSQYEIMEPPKGQELTQNGGDSILIDTTNKSMNETFDEILRALE